MSTVTAVDWQGDKVRFIDQTRLPLDEVLVETSNYRVVADALRTLAIRGAPAIGVAAAFAVALAVRDRRVTTMAQMDAECAASIEHLAQTRPTAVNLFASLDRMRDAYRRHHAAGVDALKERMLGEARAIRQEDVDACRAIGEYGASLLPGRMSVLTHCNTGALATAGEGTALSVITTAARQGKITSVFVDETRPLFQGARLTAWELKKQGIDAILITDSTAGLVLAQGRVGAVIVGADRIAANGDTANKIGTYPLAVLAARHGIPFYVAAPTSTIDLLTAAGDRIRIEERAAEEVTHVAGIRIAAEGVRVFSPAFDVTPAPVITAFITECGVLTPPFAESLAGAKRGPAGAGAP